MLNVNFKENWLKILNFNSIKETLKDQNIVEEKVRIPLSPIRINVNALYHFFELCYPKFINDQQNILDIIISDDDKKEKLLGLYLYRTRKVGIHETIKTLPKDLIRSKDVNFNRIDNLYNKLQAAIMKESGIRISSIRLFKEEAINLINKHCEDIRKISFHEFLNRILDLFQQFFEQNLFLIYPEPMFYNFFKESLELLGQIRYTQIFNFIEKLLPEFKTSFLINSNNNAIILYLQKKVTKSGKSDLFFKIFTPDELGVEFEDLNIKHNLIQIQDKLKTKHVYYLTQLDLIKFLSDLFELAIPLKKDNLQFLIQKILFVYRSFETHWDIVPRPIIYHNFIRFVIRLFGFNLNLKKISHWAIPESFFSLINYYFGLNCKILFIITDIKKHKNLKKHQKNYLNIVTEHLFLLEIENSALLKILTLNKKDLFSDRNVDSLDSIKIRVSGNYGFISSLIIIDKYLLKTIVKNYIFNHSKIAPFSKLKTLKLFKKQKYFTIYPEHPPFKLIRKKNRISLVKLVLPIVIDKHEF